MNAEKIEDKHNSELEVYAVSSTSEVESETGLKKGLKSRHIGMIAIGGIM